MTAEPISKSRLVSALTSPATAVTVLIVFYLGMLASVREKSATFDEPGNAVVSVKFSKSGLVVWWFGELKRFMGRV